MSTSPAFDVDDFLGLGLSWRTAYAYARITGRVSAILAESGSDLATCSARDVAQVVQRWRPSNSSRAQLRAALIRAWDLLERTDGPARAIRVPPKPVARCKALEEDAAVLLERAAWARDDAPGLAVLIGLYAGLRRAEIAQLRWEDVHRDEHGTATWLRVHGKGGLVADVPVHPILSTVLARHARPTGWLFPGRRHGTPVSPATIWAWVQLAARDAGLANVPTHVLRHTALAECNDRSHDLRAVQEIARHSRPETTAGYTRVSQARLRAVIAMIDYGREVA